MNSRERRRMARRSQSRLGLTQMQRDILLAMRQTFIENHGREPAPGDVLLDDEETGDVLVMAEGFRFEDLLP